MPIRLRIIATLLATGIFIAACSSPPTNVEPKFTGRLLLLNGGNANGADLAELTPAGATYNLSVLTKGVFEAWPGPDQTRLLYATKDELWLRDLRTGAVKSLVKGANYCLSWAPDGNHFSYKQRSPKGATLYSSDLDGKTKLIWEDSFTYGLGDIFGPSSVVERANASSSCAHWIAPDRLIFDRFVGGLANQKGGEAIKPNTTTLAILGNSVTLVDTERKWSIEAICPVGSAALLRPHDQGQPILTAKSLDNLKTLDPKPADCSGCRFVGFAAKSCVPFFIQDATSTSTDVVSLNPINWQRQKGGHIEQTFSLAARMLVKSSARLMVVGDAPDKLYLVDTDSGAIVAFFPRPPDAAAGTGPLQSPMPVVWIEN